MVHWLRPLTTLPEVLSRKREKRKKEALKLLTYLFVRVKRGSSEGLEKEVAVNDKGHTSYS